MSQKVTRKRKIYFDDDDYEPPTSKRKSSYKLNDKILCLYDDGHYYEAKIIEVDNHGYTIHYPGWGKRYDEFISKDMAKTHFKPFSGHEPKEGRNKLKEARKSASSSEKKTPSRSKATTKIGEDSTSSKKSKSAEKTLSNAKKNEEKSTPSTSKKIKDIEKTLSNAKEFEEIFSTPSTSNVKETSLKVRKTPAKKSKLENVFADSITKDMDSILCVEHDYIVKRKMLPKFPAKVSVEDIIKQFLKSKQIEVDERFEKSLQDSSNFDYGTYESDSVMAFFLIIFNIAFPTKLAYDGEKACIGEVLNNRSDEKGDVSKRYSAVLGLSHLLRYILCLNDLVVNSISKSHPTIVDVFIVSVKELCAYLDKNNISKFYNEHEYYELKA